MLDKRLMRQLKSPRWVLLNFGVRALALAFFAVGQAICLGTLIDGIFLKGLSFRQLLPNLCVLVLILILRPVFQGLQDIYGKNMATQVKSHLRKQLTDYAQLDYGSGTMVHQTGRLSTLAIEGIESVDAYYSEFLPQWVGVVVGILVILPVVWWYDGLSALLMLLTAPLIPVFMLLIGSRAKGEHQKHWEKLNQMNGHLLEVLRGMVTLRYFGKHRTQEKAVWTTSERFRKTTLKVLSISFLSAFTLELLATLSTAIIAVSLGLRLLYGNMDYLPALIVLMLAPEYYQPLRLLGQKFHAAMNGKIVAQALEPILNAMPVHRRPTTQTESKPCEFVVDIQNMNFAYGDKTIFSGFDLQIKRGDSLLLMGPSGVGKTTLLKLMLGAYENYEGSINVMGMEVGQLAYDSLSEQMSYVPQHPRLFKGTIEDNLLFGVKSSTVENASRLARDYAAKSGFDKVVARLPHGYNTQVGEGFDKLSGGELQLLAITRAWLRQTPIILMDEPTSAMDLVLEETIVAAMQEMQKEKTLIVAAHRPNTASLFTNRINLGGD